ncbi:MAG: hypothetical protein ABIJ56_06475 [Pseudomonadota bacterium]
MLQSEAIRILYRKKAALFDIAGAKKLFSVEKDNTLYKILQRLERKGVIVRLTSGKYRFAFREANEFETANFLLSPSYVSFESALSFHGVLAQFPYTITSATPLKSRKLVCEDREYEYSHIEKKYYFGFVRKDTLLVAEPEKALLDQLYFMSKKLRQVHVEDLDLARVSSRKLKRYARKFNYLPLNNLIDRLGLC